MSLVVFPFKDEVIDVVASNLTTAARHERVTEVWAVGAGENTTLTEISRIADELAGVFSKPIEVFPQERLGSLRPGKGDGMNTALKLSAERGFDRTHFYDADITNFDESWIDGAEAWADEGFGVVRHRFPRAATDAMITWLVTRPALALLFPRTVLAELHQPLGGELLLGRVAVESLATDDHVRRRSDWGVDTIITHATANLDVGLYEHNAPDGKRHALYGSLGDIRQMFLECLDAAASLRGRAVPAPNIRFGSDPLEPAPDDLKETVAYDTTATRAEIASPPDDGEADLLSQLGFDESPIPVVDAGAWHEVFPKLLDRFILGDRGWEMAAFRLWTARVLHYTEHVVPLGYDRAMSYLDATVHQFELGRDQD